MISIFSPFTSCWRDTDAQGDRTTYRSQNWKHRICAAIYISICHKVNIFTLSSSKKIIHIVFPSAGSGFSKKKKKKKKKFFWEKLHFITLNYTLNYTLYFKLFEYVFCSLNYDHCYTLHPVVKFVVNQDGNPKFRMLNVIESIA